MIIELMRQKFRGVLRLSRQWPSSIITPMATNVPDGFYLGKNGRLYPAKNKSLIQRMEEDPEGTKAELLGATPSKYNSILFGDGFEEKPAPSEANGTRKPPRAMTVGYNRAARMLAIEFRPRGTWSKGVWTASEPYGPIFCFADVEEEDWKGLLASGSTGKWLLRNPDIEERREGFSGASDIEERIKQLRSQ